MVDYTLGIAYCQSVGLQHAPVGLVVYHIHVYGARKFAIVGLLHSITDRAEIVLEMK